MGRQSFAVSGSKELTKLYNLHLFITLGCDIYLDSTYIYLDLLIFTYWLKIGFIYANINTNTTTNTTTNTNTNINTNTNTNTNTTSNTNTKNQQILSNEIKKPIKFVTIRDTLL